MNKDQLKQQAAEQAAELVQSGMGLGLGTGSTAVHFVNAVGRRYQAGALTNLACIPTSNATAALAQQWGLPLVDFTTHPTLDLVVDGADEIDPQLNLIKGLGGALLREKIVATAGAKMVIISDDSKIVTRLGEKTPVPVEVIPFALEAVAPYLESLGAKAVLRHQNGEPFFTDERNYILDCHFDQIDDPAALGEALNLRPGVVEHGLFLQMASLAFVAGAGGVKTLTLE